VEIQKEEDVAACLGGLEDRKRLHQNMSLWSKELGREMPTSKMRAYPPFMVHGIEEERDADPAPFAN
jgi:hypothetical protein